ncbi:hypothetical protein ES707_15200 [subsurface metagenome]
MPGQWLSTKARLISAIVFLTNVSLIEKGRLIEIEAVYISLTGIAILLWLNNWAGKRSGWLLWLAPSVVLGFGLLVKGPFILIFFYSVVISVLFHDRQLKQLMRVKHLVGIGIMLFMTLGWLYLAFQRTSGLEMTGQMSGQLFTRIIRKPDIADWGLNVLKAFRNFLPWVLFVPMLWDKKITSQIEPAHKGLFSGCRLGMLLGFIAINLMPGMESRYSMPVIPLASVLLGWSLPLHKEFVSSDRLWKNILLACFVVSCLTAIAGLIFITMEPAAIIVLCSSICATAAVFLKRNSIRDTFSLSLVTAVMVLVAMLQYSCFGLEIITSKEKRRPAAMSVNEIVPKGETLYIFRPGNQLNPVIFYIRPPISYVLEADYIDEKPHYLLIKKADLDALESEGEISDRSAEVLYKFTDRISGNYRLVHLE